MNRLRVIERGFLKGQLVYERPARWWSADAVVAEMGRIKARRMVRIGRIDMVELEFPDLPPQDRFFRIGVNPQLMVKPQQISCSTEADEHLQRAARETLQHFLKPDHRK